MGFFLGLFAQVRDLSWKKVSTDTGGRGAIPVSAVPFGAGIDIRRPCRFIGALFRSLCALPGGIGRFVLCDIGVNQCWL